MTSAEKFEDLLAKQIKKNMEKKPDDYALRTDPAEVAKKLVAALAGGQPVVSKSVSEVARSLKIKGGFTGLVAYLRDTTDNSTDVARAVQKTGRA